MQYHKAATEDTPNTLNQETYFVVSTMIKSHLLYQCSTGLLSSEVDDKDPFYFYRQHHMN